MHAGRVHITIQLQEYLFDQSKMQFYLIIGYSEKRYNLTYHVEIKPDDNIIVFLAERSSPHCPYHIVMITN